MTETELTIIVPCHNEAETLADQLDALVGQQWDGRFEIVVVDNGSTDGTVDVASRYSDRGVRVISAGDGRGVAYARNVGVRQSTGRSVAFCDGDDVVADGWVSAIGDALRSHPLVTGVLDPFMLNEHDVAHGRPSSGNDRLPTFGVIPFWRGGNGGVRRDLWERVGGFNEEFTGLEDIEFSLRLTALGFMPTLAEDAVLHYRFRGGAGAVIRQGLFYGRGRPRLTQIARELALPAPSRGEGFRSWAWLVVNLPGLRTRAGRLQWLWVLANRIGVLRGAFADRILHV